MSETSTVRVIIVDDHAILRFGLELLPYICPQIDIVGEAANGLEGLKLCEEQQPDVVLLDLLMPGMNGIETCKAIRKVCPNTRIVIMTSFVDDTLVQQALLVEWAVWALVVVTNHSPVLRVTIGRISWICLTSVRATT